MEAQRYPAILFDGARNPNSKIYRHRAQREPRFSTVVLYIFNNYNDVVGTYLRRYNIKNRTLQLASVSFFFYT